MLVDKVSDLLILRRIADEDVGHAALRPVKRGGGTLNHGLRTSANGWLRGLRRSHTEPEQFAQPPVRRG